MTNLYLPRGSLRRFREQLGTRYKNLLDHQFQERDIVIVVGDYSCYEYYKYMKETIYPIPALMIFDGKTKRDEYSKIYDEVLRNGYEYLEVQNPAGSITTEAYEMIGYCLEHDIHYLKVDGEEDLLTLAVISQIDVTDVLRDYYVVFGIPDEGVEVVRVNPEIQDHVIDIMMSMKTFMTDYGAYIGVAGTFAYLHDGHKALLRQAMALCKGKKLSVGLTTNDLMYETRYGGVDYLLRQTKLKEFFKEEGFDNYEIWPLHQPNVDMSMSNCRTLVCSTETIDNAYKLNRYQRRCTTNGQPDPPLELVEVPLVLNENGEKLSASKILGYRKK